MDLSPWEGNLSFLVLFQLAIDVALVAFVLILWQKFRKPPAEDPRLSRGLQLLQSKIAVLEDLSDRTDRQVEQLMSLLEQKGRFVQKTLLDAESEIQKIDQATRRSQEVARIFQDKIPHDEIIDRQNTIKYVKAAQMAHAGQTLQEIIAETGLPAGEAEFISKVNRDELMFDTEQLPEWAKAGRFVEQAMETPERDMSSLKKLGDEFRRACREAEEKAKVEDLLAQTESPVVARAKEVSEKLFTAAKSSIEELGQQMLERHRSLLQKPTTPSPISADPQTSKKADEILN
jgi:hypothetical protein